MKGRDRKWLWEPPNIQKPPRKNGTEEHRGRRGPFQLEPLALALRLAFVGGYSMVPGRLWGLRCWSSP